MLKWIETTGKNEDAAIEAALRQLGLERDDVSVEILERAKSGFLGIGSCPAKVKVTYEVPDEPEAPPAPQPEPVQVEKPQPAAPAAPAAPVQEEAAPTPAAAPVCDDAVAKRIEEFLTGLLEHMGANAAPRAPRASPALAGEGTRSKHPT